MPAYDPAQTSFEGGEASPRLAARVDTDFYKKALALCQNMEPTPHGSIRLRNPTQLICSIFDGVTGEAGSLTRDIEFTTSGGEDFVLILGDKTMQIYAEGTANRLALNSPNLATVITDTAELVTNGNFSAGPAGWTAAPGNNAIAGGETVDFVSYGGAVRLTQISYYRLNTHVDSGLASVSQTLVVPATADLAIRINLAGTEPAAHFVGDRVSPCAVRITKNSDNSEALNWTASYADCQGKLGGAPLALPPLHNVAAGAYTITIYTALFTSDGRHGDGGSAPIIDNVSVVASMTQTTAGAGAGSTITTPWSAAEIAQVQWAMDSSTDTMVLVHPNHPPCSLVHSGATWTPNIPQVFNAQPASWAAGAYPGAVEIFQSRLWLGSKNHLWGSKSGQLFDFAISTPVADTFAINPSSAIDKDIATKGTIQWLRGRTALLVGTDIGEYAVGAQSGTLQPADIYVVQQSAFGSAPVQAIDIGDQVLYVSRDRRKVRALEYSLDKQTWISSDLTFTAEHITAPGIREVHFGGDPTQTILVILNDGTMACCTYARGEKVVAWWRWSTQTGRVLSAAILNTTGGTVAWLVVQRRAGIFLELLPMNELQATNAYLDMSLTMAVPADLVIHNLDAFVGQTVGVVLDGALEADQVVVADNYVLVPGVPGYVVPGAAAWVSPPVGLWYIILAGAQYTYGGHTWQAAVQARLRTPDPSDPRWIDLGVTGAVIPDIPAITSKGKITLANPGRTVTVGLKIPSPKAVTLKPEGGNPGGSSQGFKVHVPEVMLRLNNSARPLVNGKRVGGGRPFSTPLDTAEELFTGDVVVTNMAVDDGTITIEQDLPLRTEVCGIFGHRQVNKI